MTIQALSSPPPQMDAHKERQVEEAARKLAGSLMGQMVNDMLKTLNLPHEQDLFLSFMGNAVGDKLAESGLSTDLEKSIKGQLIKAQEGTTPVDPLPESIPPHALQAYHGGMNL